MVNENLLTRTSEIDDIDREKMRNLARLLIKIAKRLRAEELAESMKTEVI